MIGLVFYTFVMFIIIFKVVKVLKVFSVGQINYINALQKLKDDGIISDREYEALRGGYGDMKAREFVNKKYGDLTGIEIDNSTFIKANNMGKDIINYENNPIADDCDIERYVESNNLNPIQLKRQNKKVKK
ncbi:MAG: hypothetical protein PHR25_00165 [Clostridia bacterium]|nr:hypothetical protein [Clostridia bacterium]MDD4375189.1 hypothetical protein [Clostridia bacterium]